MLPLKTKTTDPLSVTGKQSSKVKRRATESSAFQTVKKTKPTTLTLTSSLIKLWTSCGLLSLTSNTLTIYRTLNRTTILTHDICYIVISLLQVYTVYL